MSSLRPGSLFQAAKDVLWNASRIPLYFGGVVGLAVIFIKIENNIGLTGFARVTGIASALILFLVGLALSFSGLSVHLLMSSTVRSKGVTIEIKTSDGKLIAKGLDPADASRIIRALTEGTKHGS